MSWLSTNVAACSGPLHDDGAAIGQVAQIVVRRVADILQLVAQRKVEGRNLVVRTAVHLVEPAVDVLAAGPVLADHVRGELLAVLDVPVLREEADHPRAEALDEVEAEAVEAELFDQHAGVLEHRRVDHGIAMAEVGKAGEVLALHHHAARSGWDGSSSSRAESCRSWG